MEVFATLAGTTIQGQIVGVYHAKRAHDCSLLNHSDALGLNISSLYGIDTASHLTDTLYNTVSSMPLLYVVTHPVGKKHGLNPFLHIRLGSGCLEILMVAFLRVGLA